MNTIPGSSSKKVNLLTILLIVLLSLLPFVLTWGRTVIGGDMTIPFNSKAMEKYLYQWIAIQNGSYFSINYYPLYFFYKIVEFFGVSYYHISGLILFVLNLIAGLGMWKLSTAYQGTKKTRPPFIPITFYLLSPALLNSWHYLYIYSCIPWFIYLIVSCIKKNDIELHDVIYLNLVIFFASLDLPNPKYIFYLLLMTLVVSVSGYALKLIDGRLLLKIFGSFLLSILLSAYLVLPLGNFALNYSASEYGVSVVPSHSGNVGMMDLGTATINKMVSLHHSGVNVNVDERLSYTKNPYITVISYLYIVLILVDLFYMRKSRGKGEQDKHKLILLSLIAVFLVLSVGPNPPFGFIYEYFVTSVPALAFLRTTAGAVYFLSAFYSVYLFIIIQENKIYGTLLQFVLLGAIIITGYPLVNGDFYEVNTNINQYAEKNSRGFLLPAEYFLVAPKINSQKLDAKILYPRLDSSYINTTWGYFGPPFHSMLYKSTPISDKTVIYGQSYHNTSLTLVDLSAASKDVVTESTSGAQLFAGKIIELYKTPPEIFLPHLYTPQILAKSPEEVEAVQATSSGKLGAVRSAIYGSNVEIKTNVIKNNPVLEFKKINHTKYRIIVHDATENFPLIFSEAYNPGWKLYLDTGINQKESKPEKQTIIQQSYRSLDNNSEDQASKEELVRFVDNNYLSNLGSMDFISKNFQGTIQNDNLLNGNFYETWLKKPILEEEHKLVNGYANSWTIDPKKICKNDTSCNFELILEFWPQRLFYLGLIISGVTSVICLLVILVKRLNSNNNV